MAKVHKFVPANPEVRVAFVVLLVVSMIATAITFVLALIFGGWVWWGLIFSLLSGISVYALGEYVHAFDETIDWEEDDDDA